MHTSPEMVICTYWARARAEEDFRDLDLVLGAPAHQSRRTRTRHLRVLEAAGLVRFERRPE